MDRNVTRCNISQACKRLALTQNVVEMCAMEATPKQEEFLCKVLAEELAHRERMRRERLLKRANFSTRKTLSDYQWDAVRLPVRLTPEGLASCDFVKNKENLILYGPVGTGKTHWQSPLV